MKNHDITQQTREEVLQRISEAVKSDDTEAFSAAFAEFADNIQQSIIAEAKELQADADTAVLVSRGVRQLTGAENTYYQKAIEAMRSKNPRQALTELDVVMPKTVIDAVFDDLEENHPLLSAINMQNAGASIEMMINTNGNQLAAWGTLCAEIIKEMTSGFKKITMTQHKLSAFLPVCKAMLDLGPVWLDQYVRRVLYEALALGLEEGIINGTGKDMPIGMNRRVGEGVTVTDGVYPIKEAVTVTDLSPAAYGTLLSEMAKAPNGKSRIVSSVIMIVNPTDYLTKIMPATTVRATDGTYVNNVLPFPTQIIQSIQMPVGRAIIGIGSRYFMILGTGREGKIDYSDEYRFLEDERVYLIKLYGHGEPLDNNAFVYADISGLEPAAVEVVVRNLPSGGSAARSAKV